MALAVVYSCRTIINSLWEIELQLKDGPLPVISRIISPLIGGYDSCYLFIRPFIGATPLITGMGRAPLCTIHLQ